MGPMYRIGDYVLLTRKRPGATPNAKRLTPKADRSAQSRELAPTGPFGFWLEKIFCYSLSPVLDKLSIHTGFVISVFICSQWVSGFVSIATRETS
jgi:hypothetical protein